ncbi:MAG: FAD-dependent oxidoreductase [bacterium]
MPKPMLFVVDDDPGSLQRVERELARRYGADYDIASDSSASKALWQLENLRAAGREVTLILSDLVMPGMDGIAFMSAAREIVPEAKRALMVDLGDISCAGTLLQTLTFGQADHYMAKPFRTPDEQFHRAVTELLEEWAQVHRGQFQFVRIVGEQWSPRSSELRDMLHRGGIPNIFYDVNTEEGRRLLKAVDAGADVLPVCVLYNAEVLVNPTNAELDAAIGVSTYPPDELFDLAIVGAGPAGLSAAVYAASEGLHTIVLEPEAPGGQAGTSSLVRNYLGFPRGISGGDLMRQAYRQAWLFQARFNFSRRAVGLRVNGRKRVVMLSDDLRVSSRAVLLAVGITYRRLGIPRADELIGAGVFYGSAASEAQAMRDKQVFVVGGGNSAGQAALHLARYARQVRILVRGGSLAESMSDYLIREIQATRNIEVLRHSEVIEARGGRLLEGLVLRNNAAGRTEEVEAAALFILIGGVPHTEWLPPAVRRDEQGYILTGRDLVDGGPAREAWPEGRAPLPLETSIPGVFAAGDVRHGAAKRIASAVGEGSVAIGQVHQYLAHPGT